jgi:hypothetical protein
VYTLCWNLKTSLEHWKSQLNWREIRTAKMFLSSVDRLTYVLQRQREREREERMRERERERVPLWVLPNKSPVSGKKYQNASCSFNQSLYPRSIVLIDIIHYYDGIRFSSNLISHDLTFHQTLLNVLHTPICIHSFIDEFTCS